MVVYPNPENPLSNGLSAEEETSKIFRFERISNLQETVVSPDVFFFRGSVKSIRSIWLARNLLKLLSIREIRARYKNSALGVLWSLAKPLLQLAIYYFAIGKLLGADRSTPNFAIFVFVGLTTWSLFAEVLASSTTSILRDSGLVKKVNVPREIFPFSSAISSLVNFGTQCVVLVAGITVFSSYKFGPEIFLVPISLIMLFVLASSVGMLLSAWNVYLRDVEHFVEVFLIAFFWLSPIVYPFSMVANLNAPLWVKEVYSLNPVTLAITGMQKGLWAPGLSKEEQALLTWPVNLELKLIIALLISFCIAFICQRIFSRLQGNFAQEI